MFTVKDWITSSGLYPERSNSVELTPEVLANAQIWCDKVGAFLDDLGYTGPESLTSGFRPSEVNAATPNAAKHSGHEIGKAGDVKDDAEQSLCKLVMSRPDLLLTHGLMMEDLHSTKGQHTNWCHLDFITRHPRPSQTFIP